MSHIELQIISHSMRVWQLQSKYIKKNRDWQFIAVVMTREQTAHLSYRLWKGKMKASVSDCFTHNINAKSYLIVKKQNAYISNYYESRPFVQFTMSIVKMQQRRQILTGLHTNLGFQQVFHTVTFEATTQNSIRTTGRYYLPVTTNKRNNKPITNV